jgi:hypothetical protein
VRSHRVRAGIALLALGAACVWPAAGSGQVLYRSSARISRLTVSGGRMAWAEQVSRTCVRLFRRRVVGATPVRVTRCRLPSQPVASGHTWIRLIGPHVFWDETGRGNTEVDEWVYSTLPGGRRMPVTYAILCGGSSGAGKLLGAVSARALVYSVFTVQTDGDCGVLSGTGVVRRTVVAGAGARRVLVPGAPGADMLAVEQGDPGTDAVRSHSCGISHAEGGPQGATIERWGRGNPGHRTCVRRFAAGGSGSWSRRPAARRW